MLDGELDDLLLHLVPPDHLEPVRPDPRSPTRLTEVHANHGWCDDVFAIVSFCREIHAFLADDLVRGDLVDRVMDGLTKDRLEGVGQGMPGPKGRRGVGFGSDEGLEVGDLVGDDLLEETTRAKAVGCYHVLQT